LGEVGHRGQPGRGVGDGRWKVVDRPETDDGAPNGDSARADEARTDEARTDEARTDQARADEARTDPIDADRSRLRAWF